MVGQLGRLDLRGRFSIAGHVSSFHREFCADFHYQIPVIPFGIGIVLWICFPLAMVVRLIHKSRVQALPWLM